ncbi:MAG: ATP-grasp domain-containing protein [bacterium]|nr:ATP-grasp domain-containing protein [bacterium]
MLKVILLYNLKNEAEVDDDDPPDSLAEYDAEHTVLAIRDALVSGGYEVHCYEGNLSNLCQLQKTDADIAFNICEGRNGRNREARVPAVLEMIGLPCTGSDVLTLAVCLDKATTKKLLVFEGLPTPRFAVCYSAKDCLSVELQYPLMVKPVHEGSSIGISSASKVLNAEELEQRVEYICSTYKQPALVEEFSAGREFTGGVIGNHPNLRELPIMEIDFSKVPKEANNMYTYQYKKEWTNRDNFLCPAPISKELSERLRELARGAFLALGCRDFARVDFRMSHDGKPYIIEVNPLPGLAPGYSDFPVATAVMGITYQELILDLLHTALRRIRGER